MLVHHTDPQFVRVVWIGDRRFLSVNKYLAFILMVQPEKNIHKRTFSCSVLPKQTMDLLFIDSKINSVVCPDASETLYDPCHLDCFHICHLSSSVSVQFVRHFDLSRNDPFTDLVKSGDDIVRHLDIALFHSVVHASVA